MAAVPAPARITQMDLRKIALWQKFPAELNALLLERIEAGEPIEDGPLTVDFRRLKHSQPLAIYERASRGAGLWNAMRRLCSRA